MALEFGHAPGPGGPCVLGALCVLASAGDFTVTVTVFCLSYYSEYGFMSMSSLLHTHQHS